MANTTATAPTGAGSMRWAATVGVLGAVAGSLLGTWVTSELDGSPELKLAGAVLGAVVPAVLGEFLKKDTRPWVALLVAVVAVGLTYLSFTAAAYVMEKPATFPLPPGAPSPTGTIRDGDGGLALEITPARLECSEDGCAEPVTITNTGDLPLRIDAIEVTDDATGSFRLDPASTCANRTLPAPGDSCSFELGYTPPTGGGTARATLVIHQNLPLYPSYVPLVGSDGEVVECVVPDVVGQQYGAAEQALVEACSSAVTPVDVASDLAAGTVVGTDPPAGSSAEVGGEITVQVSDGSGQQVRLTVPEVRGRAASDAYTFLAEEGFTNVEVRDASGGEVDPAAEVVGMSPAAGSVVAPDDPVVLEVAVEESP